MRKTLAFLSVFAVYTLPASADWYERPYDPNNPPTVVVQPGGIPFIKPLTGGSWEVRDRVRETQQRLEHQRLMNEYLRNQIELQRRQLHGP